MAGRESAVVIGSGIAGLTAAAVLARHFAQVRVLDRDELVDEAAPRAHVPQGGHPHVLLAAGLNGLEELFGGIGAELTSLGATEIDFVRDLYVFRGIHFPQVPSGVVMLGFSRPLLEQVLRRRLAGMSNVELLGSTPVTGLVGSRRGVTGVVVAGGPMAADLVVDASGRSASHSDRWLSDLGLATPRVSVITVDVGYTTVIFRRRPDDLADARMALVVPEAPQTRIGIALPIEGDRWLVTLGGWHGDHAPRDPTGFAAFAQSLPDPVIADLIARAERLSDATFVRFAATRRRHLERLHGRPAGYVALGDAVCSFNPIYGQGMTSAVQQAMALGRALDRHRYATARLARDFYRAAGRVIATPWQFAAGGDFLYPQTIGKKPFGMDLFNGYARRLNRACALSPEIQITMARVNHLLEPPSAVMRPALILKVLRLTRGMAAR